MKAAMKLASVSTARSQARQSQDNNFFRRPKSLSTCDPLASAPSAIKGLLTRICFSANLEGIVPQGQCKQRKNATSLPQLRVSAGISSVP
jgi:hypothetical protein